MFKLNEKHEVKGSISKCDYIRYRPSEISAIITANSQLKINLRIEDSVSCLLKSYLDSNFDVLHAATYNRYTNANELRLVNFDPIGLFSIYKLTTSSGKHLEAISHAHNVSLMYKLTITAKGSDYLFIGVDRD